MTIANWAAVLLLASASVASAATTTYECRIDPKFHHYGWLPQVVFIARADGAKTATISDPIILHFNDRQPITGKVATDNARRTTFSWRVETRNQTNQRAKMDYRATIQKATGELNISAQPLGYANSFVAQGSCQRGQLKQ